MSTLLEQRPGHHAHKSFLGCPGLLFHFHFLYLKSTHLFILLSILRQFHCVALDARSSRVPRLSVLGAQGKLPVSGLFSLTLSSHSSSQLNCSSCLFSPSTGRVKCCL